jgi:O-methyltransferase
MTDEHLLNWAMKHSVMGPKLTHLLKAAKECSGLEGDFAEVGVYRGGSALVLCHCAAPGQWVYGFDTYTGIPEDDSEVPDGHKKGDFAESDNASIAQGQKNFYPVVGRFEETSEKYAWRRFAFAHIDCDISQTAMFAARFFADRITKGGGIFFDDAHSAKTAGVRKAINVLLALGQYDIEEGHGTAFLRKVR